MLIRFIEDSELDVYSRCVSMDDCLFVLVPVAPGCALLLGGLPYGSNWRKPAQEWGEHVNLTQKAIL